MQERSQVVINHELRSRAYYLFNEVNDTEPRELFWKIFQKHCGVNALLKCGVFNDIHILGTPGLCPEVACNLPKVSIVRDKSGKPIYVGFVCEMFGLWSILVFVCIGVLLFSSVMASVFRKLQMRRKCTYEIVYV